MIAACLEALVSPSRPSPREQSERWDDAVEAISQEAFAFYRGRIAEDSKVLEVFRAGDSSERTGACARWIASGAAFCEVVVSRTCAQSVGVWVDAESARGPAWFGVGYALERFRAWVGARDAKLLREMMQRLPVIFRAWCAMSRIAMAKADMSIARLYAERVTDTRVRDRVCMANAGGGVRPHPRRSSCRSPSRAGVAGEKPGAFPFRSGCAIRMSIR